MNKTRLLLGGPLIALCLAIGLGGIAIRARESAQLPRQMLEDIRADVGGARPITFSVLAHEHRGPLTAANLQAQIELAQSEAIRQGLDSVWANYRPSPIVIITEDPTGKEDCRMKIGLPVPPEAEIKAQAPLNVERLKFDKAVRHLHKGPHAQLGDVYRAIDEELKKAGQGASFPVVLQILEDPFKVDAPQLRTVINVPAK